MRLRVLGCQGGSAPARHLPGLLLDDTGVVVPLAVGLSLKDYYEFGTGSDDTFGYFSGGVTVSVPLAFIPPDFGKWLVKAGVTVLYLGDNLKTIDDGDRVQVIGTVGLAFAY